MASDPRLTPARGDIAASHLKGQVEAKTFVDGVRLQVAQSHAALRAAPEDWAEQVNQALFGETFMAYDQANGWAWGQLEADGYVGWMALAALTDKVAQPTHRVSVLRTFVFDRPDLKSQPLMALSINAKLAAGEAQKNFVRVEGSGWVFAGHIAPLSQVELDFVAVAERFVGAPYLWGGRDSIGVDCSGLVQMSLEATGVNVLRDSGMQAETVGEAIEPAPDFSNLRRGDLIFWPGHVGIMLDGARLLHANAWHMATEIEPLAEAVARIAKVAGPVKAVRRL